MYRDNKSKKNKIYQTKDIRVIKFLGEIYFAEFLSNEGEKKIDYLHYIR